MRYLKNKVSKAIERHQALTETLFKKESLESSKPRTRNTERNLIKQEQKITIKEEYVSTPKQETAILVKCEPIIKAASKVSTKGSPPTRKKEIQTNKNIVKNYARAMVNFTLSDMANSYLDKILTQENLELKQFKTFVAEQKEDINSIKTLREVLLISDEEESQIQAYKRAFRAISVIFIKFFSVNWIFNSKLGDKKLHLKYRFKILRRVRNPEHFTYLENFNKTK